MYKTYFGLKREPFSVAADPRFIYMSPQHRQAAQHLLFGLQSGAGFILLTGEIGSGKTMVCRAFLRLLPPNADVANVVNPRVDFRALLMRICEDLRIEVAPDCHDPIDAIHGHLLLAHAQGRRTLIVVDEAQALSHEVLELLRLLTNLDSTGRKLQIFLVGQPDLRNTLRLPALEPVSQRIVARFHLGPLEEPHTGRYIEHRLRKAGLAGSVPFDAGAMRAIHRACAGVPRRINVLCDRAMLTAKNLGTQQIDARMIERIVPQVFDLCDAAAVSNGPRWRKAVYTTFRVLAGK
jgi:general secretion pathway protein A